jgi:rubrerythrin
MKCVNCGLEIPDCISEKTKTAIRNEIAKIECDLIFYQNQYAEATTRTQRVAINNCRTYDLIKKQALEWVLNQ